MKKNKKRKMRRRERRLVEDHLWMAEVAASRWADGRVSRTELYSAACEALCACSMLWEHGRGVLFNTYAYKRVDGAVKREYFKLLGLSGHLPEDVPMVGMDDDDENYNL